MLIGAVKANCARTNCFAPASERQAIPPDTYSSRFDILVNAAQAPGCAHAARHPGTALPSVRLPVRTAFIPNCKACARVLSGSARCAMSVSTVNAAVASSDTRQ